MSGCTYTLRAHWARWLAIADEIALTTESAPGFFVEPQAAYDLANRIEREVQRVRRRPWNRGDTEIAMTAAEARMVARVEGRV